MNFNPKKVIILCPYSTPSYCGVWSRAWSDAVALKNKGYIVHIFSSNIVKGTSERSGEFEEIEGIKIYRFKVLFSLGANSMFWNFFRKFREINPDIVHAHGYRHPHSLFSLIIAKLGGKFSILTTHAPFEKDSHRSFFLKTFDVLYDLFIGWWQLKLYTKVIRISEWENFYLARLGFFNAILIPNGVSPQFFIDTPKIENLPPKKSLIYMGRVDPVKRVEWIIEAAKLLPQYLFKIRGPLNSYENFETPSQSNFSIELSKYNSEEFIKELEYHDIYLLMSIREALPFSLLEAMSRGKIVITSDSRGGGEVVVAGVNGFIVKSVEELVSTIQEIYEKWSSQSAIRLKAIETARKYSAQSTNESLLNLYKSLIIFN
jgi:glycosyltransferase involved in cell wall biosynthesis